MEFLIEIGSTIYDISEIVTRVSYTDNLNDGCSKLEFSYLKDNGLNVKNGSVVRFKYKGSNIFYGYVFKVNTSNKEEINVTAYDQLRYTKAKDTIVVSNDNIGSLVKKMGNYFGLNVGHLDNTGYVLPLAVQDDKTWLDIIYDAIADTLVGTGRKYALRDEFGSLTLRNLESLTTNLILGDESLVYGYDYVKTIDEDFYNQVKLVSDNETTGKRDTYIVRDGNSISDYGLLQYFEVLDKNANYSYAKNKADGLLKLYNREVETLNLNCLGDTSIRAGNSFYAYIDDLKLNKRLIVKTVTHSFLPNHTMDMEVIL